MTRRILIVALALAVVVVVLYLGYGNYGAKRAGASGEVYSNDTSSGRLKSSSDTDTSSARPVSSPAPAASQPVTYPPAAEQAQRTTAGTPALSSGMPATDSISPNPTNGEVFAGTGKYQLYRQGNITWRLDTDTGQTCVIFATDEEWKKSKVMNAGCRGR